MDNLNGLLGGIIIWFAIIVSWPINKAKAGWKKLTNKNRR